MELLQTRKEKELYQVSKAPVQNKSDVLWLV